MILNSNGRGGHDLDNLVIERIWQDDQLIELLVTAYSDYVSIKQTCYIGKSELSLISEKILYFSNNSNTHCYVEFGKKEGDYTPSFSMCINPMDKFGHITIEMDMEIADNTKRCHRCLFYIHTELEALKKLGKSLNNISDFSKKVISLIETTD